MNIYIDKKDSYKRVDVFLKEKLDLSRSYISKLLKQKNILCNNNQIKPSYVLKENDFINIKIPEVKETKIVPIAGDLNIVFEDSDLIVLSKPANIVVHHGAGINSPTLVNHIIHYCKDLSGIGGELRPGIVHRLDKETSGLIIIAKNDIAHINLSLQFSQRTIEKTYIALVANNIVDKDGKISNLIGRDKKNRKKISENTSSPRSATTYWKKIRSYNDFTLVEAYPKTGRTHQIRVHMTSLGHPIIGDKLYFTKNSANLSKNLKANISRHLLHASKIKFIHPTTKKKITLYSEVPEDMQKIIDILEEKN